MVIRDSMDGHHVAWMTIVLHVHDETHSSIMVAVHIDNTAITTVPCHASHRYRKDKMSNPNTTVFVGNLDKAVGDDELVALFAHIGDICLATVKRHENNKSKK